KTVGRSTTDVVPWRLGNYELEQRLGTGGMGDVYKARHTQFGRVRAVKVIKQHFVDTGHHEVIRRFYQEIKAVGALEHPNIVVAIDSSAPTDSVHYLVMEYIEGVGTDELVVRHGPLPVPEACEIARQAARGLAYIDQHGMVHRDIKPSNLMVTLVHTNELGGSAKPQAASEDPQAVVKILDLGLALLVGDDQQRLTLFDHRAMGTAMYMSPEQWKTTSVDIRADIYSLGCTLYHLLAGKPP
ncbi:MAG: serine/threonine-protein kinase, partial [Pirellulales bacterium]